MNEIYDVRKYVLLTVATTYEVQLYAYVYNLLRKLIEHPYYTCSYIAYIIPIPLLTPQIYV